MKKNNKTKKNKGFTLIETMVAVSILAISLVSLLGLTSRSLFTARYSRDKITANYLLQEAVDYIRNQRDIVAFQNKLTPGSGWTGFLDKFGYSNFGSCFDTNGCYFDVNNLNLSIQACSITNPSFGTIKCPVFNYDENATNNSFYNYNTNIGIPSNFKRKIFLEYISGSNELKIIVTMEWLNGSVVKTKSISTSLLSWL